MLPIMAANGRKESPFSISYKPVKGLKSSAGAVGRGSPPEVMFPAAAEDFGSEADPPVGSEHPVKTGAAKAPANIAARRRIV